MGRGARRSRRGARLVLALAVVAGTAAGCGGTAAELVRTPVPARHALVEAPVAGATAADYVEAVCAAMGEILERGRAAQVALRASGDDRQALQRAVVVQFDALLEAVVSAERALDAVGAPATPGGTDGHRALVLALQRAEAGLSGVLGAARSLDPTGSTASTDFADLAGRLAASVAGVTPGLRALDTPALDAAARASSTCRAVADA